MKRNKKQTVTNTNNNRSVKSCKNCKDCKSNKNTIGYDEESIESDSE